MTGVTLIGQTQQGGTGQALTGPHIAYFDGATAFSVSAWIYNLGLGFSNPMFLSQDQLGATQWEFTASATVRSRPNGPFVQALNAFRGAIGFGQNKVATVTGCTILQVNVLYHLVLVYDGSQVVNTDRVALYVNSVREQINPYELSAGLTVPSSLQDQSAAAVPFSIGKANTGSPMNGTVGSPVIWSRALSQAEVTQLNNKGVGFRADQMPAGLQAGAIHGWPFVDADTLLNDVFGSETLSNPDNAVWAGSVA